jgi:curved DNA-binding protein CbpA
MHSHYDTLKVARQATTEEIKRAWKRMSFLHHPDRFPEAERQKQTDIIKAINEAWRVLGDAESRQRYDRWLDEQQAADTQSTRQDRQEQEKRTEQEYADFWRHVETMWENEYQLQKRKEAYFRERRREDFKQDMAEKSAAVKSFIHESQIVDKSKSALRRLFKLALVAGAFVIAAIVIAMIHEATKGISQSQVYAASNSAPTREAQAAEFYQDVNKNITQVNQTLPKPASKGVTLESLEVQASTLTYVFSVNTAFSKGFSEAKLRQNLLDAFDHGNLKKVCEMGNSQPGVPADFHFAYRYQYRDRTITVSLPFSEACPAAYTY